MLVDYFFPDSPLTRFVVRLAVDVFVLAPLVTVLVFVVCRHIIQSVVTESRLATMAATAKDVEIALRRVRPDLYAHGPIITEELLAHYIRDAQRKRIHASAPLMPFEVAATEVTEL